jgi:acyl transferase domain-containing protein
MCDGYPEDIQPDSRTSLQSVMIQTMSNTKTFYASRISFVFDFKGPSMIVDTACSASMSAMTLAMNDIKLGIN